MHSQVERAGNGNKKNEANKINVFGDRLPCHAVWEQKIYVIALVKLER